MLDSVTKHRIDNARDILVGKVPDPKAQVEQITTALIYKFMDDMDQESIALGGVASFFVGEYAKFAWPKVIAKSQSGYERLALYSEAITKMSQNPNLPQLFRDIFKDAFLPYRDPETLNLFLKEIDGFMYDNSERLGDAFEYLLSVMGSQGAAGQFRTPRHIIDFIVEVVAPTKTDTVLDPACGTAGFLISAYKHILAKNQKKKLSPDEMARLTKNFVGYDISPEMVRLSQVNMYLHQFPKPTVFEYDTLTSEERWDDSFDVILANPPFMSPKGGIRPHTRFSVQAKRSEVLFVDYIAEHLNPNGRAGVIVPEGIIFQSANAYKALRKMLIEENYLYAVVSLPAGVFNPYSGVKTSILLMDKTLAKQTDKILFVNIENDGFGLGAQRREIESNDLPESLQIIRDFQSNPNSEPSKPNLANIVTKPKIVENGDFNLTGGRYKESTDYSKVKWPMVELENLITYIRGVTYTKSDEVAEGGKRVLRANNINLNSNSLDLNDIKSVSNNLPFKETQKLKKDDIFICSASGSEKHIGKVAFINSDLPYYIGGFMAVIRTNENLLPKYLFELLKGNDFRNHIKKSTIGANIRNLKSSILKKYKIPLPPLEVQQAIVDEVEGYQKIIDGARQVVENYKPRIKVDPEWPMVKLGGLVKEIKSGFASGKSKINGPGVPHLRPMNINSSGMLVWEGTKYISKEIYAGKKNHKLLNGDILFNNTNSKELVGKTCYVSKDIIGGYSNHITRIRTDNNILNPKFLSFLLHNYWHSGLFKELCNKWVGQAGINNKMLSSLIINLPSIEVQKTIVAQIEIEQKIIDANRKLIEIFEKKIEEKIGEVWGEG